jgi:uncharacterized integral membrane protein (TIGR00698 family)
MSSSTSQPVRSITIAEKLMGVTVRQLPSLIPGLIAAALLSVLSQMLSDCVGERLSGFDKTPISVVMLAVLLGLVISAAVRIPDLFRPGLSFAMKKVLRLGIILLGIRLNVLDVFRLGMYGVPIVVSCILGALLVTTRIIGWLKLPRRLGTLITVGTAICGVSAIVATGPAIEADDEEVAYAVAIITLFGLVGTIVYPYLANAIFAADTLKAGLFLGTSVHDTSQVIGAAKVYSDTFSAPSALDIATVTKLVRNVSMVIILPVMAFNYSRIRQQQVRAAGMNTMNTRFTEMLPLFIIGFLALATIRSLGDVGIGSGGAAFGLWNSAAWESIHRFVKVGAESLLVVALAGVGLNTSFEAFKGLGIRPLIAGLAAALAVGIVSYTAISLLASLVTL